MNRNKILIISLIVLILLSAAIIFVRSFAEDKTAKIYQNGTLIREIELGSLTEPLEFEIAGNDGHKNTVRAECGRICMISADCPDKICVNQGWIENGVVPIVCLPNKVTIEITGVKNETDAQSGGI